jgi:hypothetical protein
MLISLAKQAPCHEIIVKRNLKAPVVLCFGFAKRWSSSHVEICPYNTFGPFCKPQKSDVWFLNWVKIDQGRLAANVSCNDITKESLSLLAKRSNLKPLQIDGELLTENDLT